MPKRETVEIIYEMRKITPMLEEASSYGLLSEVIAFSLLAMQENSSLTLSEAFEAGMQEWDLRA